MSILSKLPGGNAHAAEIRPRLLQDFLIFHLERGTFKDKLCWVDRSKMLFKIFWRHQSSSKFSPDEDSCVFKTWAMMKNLWNPDDEKALSKAKQRLRAALLKLKSVKYEEREGESRIYKIISKREIELQERTVKDRNSLGNKENPLFFLEQNGKPEQFSSYYEEKNLEETFFQEQFLIFPGETFGRNVFTGGSLEENPPEFFSNLNFSVPMDLTAEDLESDLFIDKILSSQPFNFENCTENFLH